MGLGASLALIAAGAILVWGVTAEVAGIDVDAIGVILMVVGIVGLLISLFFLSSARRGPTDGTVVRDRRDVY